MFYFKMEKVVGDTPHAPKASHATQAQAPQGFKHFQRGNFRASVMTGELFAFCHESGPYLLIGESHYPPAQKELDDLLCLARRDDGNITWDGSVASLVIADLDKGTVRVMRSGSLERPIYFHDSPTGLSITSHVRLFPENGIKLELDEKRFPEFLVYRTIMPPETLFYGIGYLPGGWSLTKDFSQSSYRLTSAWRPFPETHPISVEQAADEALETLKGSIGAIASHDPRATVLLSGGLDSTILAGIAKGFIDDISSVSSGFHAITGDPSESDYARSAAEALGTCHAVYDVTGSHYLDGLIDSIDTTCEPIHHLQSAVLGLLFQGGIDPGSKYLICGEGADSLSCNGAHFNFWRWKSVYKYIDTAPVKALLGPITKALSARDQRFAHFYPDHSNNTDNPRHFIWSLGAYGDAEWVKSHFRLKPADLLENRRSLLRAYADLPVMDKITMVSLLSEADETIKIWGLLAERRGKMLANPFTDPRFIRLSMSLDWELKAFEIKRLLRMAARRQKIPESIISRPKRSFGFPIRAWAPEGALFQPIVEMAGDTFDPALLKSLQTIHPARAMILWGYINLWIWKKLFADHVDAETLKREIRERAAIKKANNK